MNKFDLLVRSTIAYYDVQQHDDVIMPSGEEFERISVHFR